MVWFCRRQIRGAAWQLRSRAELSSTGFRRKRTFECCESLGKTGCQDILEGHGPNSITSQLEMIPVWGGGGDNQWKKTQEDPSLTFNKKDYFIYKYTAQIKLAVGRFIWVCLSRNFRLWSNQYASCLRAWTALASNRSELAQNGKMAMEQNQKPSPQIGQVMIQLRMGEWEERRWHSSLQCWGLYCRHQTFILWFIFIPLSEQGEKWSWTRVHKINMLILQLVRMYIGLTFQVLFCCLPIQAASKVTNCLHGWHSHHVHYLSVHCAAIQ